VQATEMVGADTCLIKANAPLGELQSYSNQLKSMTGGTGSYSMEYSHDEPTPAHIQQDVIAAFKGHAAEE
jgi:elongation factor G